MNGLASTKALVVALGLLAALPARGASLQPVSSWGASGVPATVSMYIYVPDKLATKPPVLVCAHYCGGSAVGVFGEAQGGGIVRAADKYGFIMVFPQAVGADGKGRCWDVGSTRSLTHDGGGDTQAIAQMVKYTIQKYDANPDRVYASGTSSGAMMTEALLAIYPEIFKGGVEFAGVPAGCWAVNSGTDGTWSGPCAGGQVTHTAAEWGDIARKTFPGYTGHRPRVQLWHGDADDTINYRNHTEAIKQWTNVLGLTTTPTSTSAVSLAGKQWTRESWKNACGYTVLDAWTEKNGPHGTSANLNADYTIPFLALDQAGLVDPEIAQCGQGSSSSSSGASGSSGSGSSSGSTSSSSSSSSSSGGASSSSGSASSSGSSGSASSSGSSSGSPGGSSSSSGGTSSGGGGTSSSSGGSEPSASGGDPGTHGNGAGGVYATTGCSSLPGAGSSMPRADLGVLGLLGLTLWLRLLRRARGVRRCAGGPLAAGDAGWRPLESGSTRGGSRNRARRVTRGGTHPPR